MSGEIRPIFTKEAEAQLDLMTKGLDNILVAAQKLNSSKVSFGSDSKKNVDDLTNAQKELNAQEKENKKTAKSLIAAKARLKTARSQEGKELVKTRAEIAAVNRETKASTTAYGRYSLAVKEAKDQAKEYGAQLIELKSSGTASNEEIEEATQKYEEAATAASGMDKEIKELDSSVGDNQRNVGNYQGAIDGVLGSFNVMGVNLGQLSKSLQTNIAAGKGYVSAMKASTAATLSGSSSLKIFKLALASTGIGLLVLALGAVIVAVQKFQPLMDAVSVIMAQIGQVVSILVDRFVKLGKGLISIFTGNPAKGFKEIQESASGLNEELAEEVVLAGKLQKQLIELSRSQEILNVAVTQARAKVKELENVYNSSTASIQEKSAAIEEAIELQKDITKAQEENQKSLIANTFGYTEYNDKVRKVVEEISNLDNIYASSEERARIFNKTLANLGLNLSSDEETEEFVAMIAELSQITLDGESKLKRLGSQSLSLTNQLNSQAKANRDAEMERIASIDELNRSVTEQLAFELNEKLNLLGLNKALSELTKSELSARIKLETEFNEKIAEQQELEAMATLNKLAGLKEQATAYGENIEKLEQLLASGKATEENQAAINKELEFYKQGLADVEVQLSALGVEYQELFDVQSRMTKEIQGISDAAAESEERLKEAFESGKISGEEFIKGLEDVNNQLQIDLVNASIRAAEDILANEVLAAEDRLALEKKLIEDKEALRKLDIDNAVASAEQQIANAELAAEERLAIEEGFQKAKEEAIQLAFDTAQDLAALVAENRKTALDDEFTEFKEDKDRKDAYNAELLANGAITQEEFNQRKLRSDQQLEKKENELRVKKAKADKRVAIFNSIINTAQAVLQALSSAPPPASFVLAGIAAAQGAAQTAVIAAQKIPKFAKGTKNSPEGIAEVGEQGAELIKYPDGSMAIAPNRMLTYLPKGSEVLTAGQTKSELSKNDMSVHELKGLRKDLRRKNMSVTIIQNSSSNLDYINARI